MGLVARMKAEEVTGRRGVQNVACGPDEEGAKLVEEVYGNYHYGVPVWLEGATHVRPVEGKGSENFKLAVVRSTGPDDPSNEWFEASPNGELTMTIQNPRGFGFVRAGEEYRVTIERWRGPRDRQLEREILDLEIEVADAELSA